jgi:sarcosine oxidase subunit gamma
MTPTARGFRSEESSMTRQQHDFDLGASQAPTTVTPVAPKARFSLRARPASAGAIGEALGLALPGRISEVARSGEREVACFGPDEWMLLAPQADRDTLVAAMRDLAVPHAFCDVSDREITYAIAGPAAGTLLATGVARDLDRLVPGRAVRTAFDGTAILLWRDGPDAFRLDVWRSFAPHVRALLARAERELAAGL